MHGIQRGVVFTPSQMRWIDARAREFSVTASEVIRRIIDEKRESLTARST